MSRLLSLNELLEFNDLLAVTVRGESPLLDSLKTAADNESQRFGVILHRLCRELENGSSLTAALNAQPEVFDQQYREVVQAGEEGQHLGPVLEAYSSYLWQVIQLRRTLGKALLYPVLVAVVAYLLFISVGAVTIQRFVEFYASTPMELTPLLKTLQWVYAHLWYWFWIPPALLVWGLLSWCLNRKSQLEASGSAGILKWVPGVGPVLRLHRLANFTEILALMLQEKVPFAQALKISAHASTDRQLIQYSDEPARMQDLNLRLPPFLRWLMRMSAANSDLGQTMHHAAEMYRRRAEVASEWLRLLAPVCFLLLIGGGATFFYVLTVFYPFTQMLNQL